MAALHFLPEAADLLQLWCAHAYFRAATRPRRRRPARLLLARQAFAHARTVLARSSRPPTAPPLLPAGVYKDAACTELILEDVVAEGSSTNEMSVAFGNQSFGAPQPHGTYDPSVHYRH